MTQKILAPADENEELQVEIDKLFKLLSERLLAVRPADIAALELGARALWSGVHGAASLALADQRMRLDGDRARLVHVAGGHRRNGGPHQVLRIMPDGRLVGFPRRNLLLLIHITKNQTEAAIKLGYL